MHDRKIRCADVRRLADAFVDGELPVERSLDILAHQAHCGACNQRIRELSWLKRRIKQAVRKPDDAGE